MAAELLSAESIKKEPADDDAKFHLQLTSPSSSVSRHLITTGSSSSSRSVMSVSASGRVLSNRTAGSNSCGQKTILLVQAVSKTSSSAGTGGGASGSSIQSLLLPTAMRTTGDLAVSTGRHLGSSSLARLSSDSLTVTPARLGVRVVSVPSSSSMSGPLPGHTHVDVQTAYGLVFNSRTIQADGTVCTSKEYLCNFCQFKVSTATALLEHSATHLFACNHCSFRSTSRLESLIHKRDSHPSTTDELAGFEDLDHPTLVLKTGRVTRVVGPSYLPPASSASGRLSGISPVVSYSSRPAISLLSSPSCGPVAKPMPSVCAATSSSMTNVIRTMSGKTGDSYFTYRIAHDTDGRVQAYECDVCGFRSVHINEMFAHASTHSLADLAKSGTATANNVVWECFYCPFFAPLQASVVSHVIASHPKQPIQLKRLPTTPSAAAEKSASEPTSLRNGSFKTVLSGLEVSPPVPEEPASNTTTLLSAATADNEPAKSADVRLEKKKKSDAGDEGCIWGCYYCSMQSASRNDIISHLKKQHSSEKLVVTRRRITHVATSGTSSSGKVPATDATGERKKMPSLSPELSEPRAPSGENDPADHSGRAEPGKVRKRQLSAAMNHEDQQSGMSLLAAGDNCDSGDGSHAVGASSAKSRRKQMAPRRVADEIAAAAAEKVIAEASADLVKGVSMSHPTSETSSAVTVTVSDAGSPSSLLGSGVSQQRKHGRTSTSKYDNLIKKLKMAESGENGIEITSLLDKPRLDESHKTSSTSRSSRGKALSLLTGQLVTGYVQPPNGIPALSSPGHDVSAPVLNSEAKAGQSRRPSCGLKINPVRYVRKKFVDRSRCYAYDRDHSTARCGVCGTTARGSGVLSQIREHVAAHFSECRWACSYCAFQCNRRAAIVAHATQRHSAKPLRLICRRLCHNSTVENESSQELEQAYRSSDVGTIRKLRGPRCHRDQLHVSATNFMWQCAFCSRRSLFRGLIVIHMKLAHVDNDDSICDVPRRWLRPPVELDSARQDTKEGRVYLVRIEDVDHYPSLSDVILTNGADLIRELDVDDDGGVDKDADSVATGNCDTAEFRCMHCHFRGRTPAVVKCHVLHTHRSEDVTILDMRTSRRLNHEHLLMCRNVECEFVSSNEKDFKSHMETHPSHCDNDVIILPPSEPRLAVQPPRLSPHTKNSNKSTPLDAASVTSSRALVTAVAKPRRGTDGPIEFNDDGTMRGLELGSRAGNMNMQCTHCCTTMSCDVAEMRSHLAASHPRLVPLAIDVDCTDTSLPASLFCCVVADCRFITSYYNVYKHHMDLEHPDSEPGSSSKHRLSSGSKRKNTLSVGRSSKHDRSFTANVRRSKKPTAVLNSVDNGRDGCSLSTSVDDFLMPSSTDDGDSVSTARRSTSQYSSQDFDFSCRYKCVLCSFTTATLADMKSHLISSHESSTPHQCVDRRARQLRKRQGINFCPDPNCAFCCKFDDELGLHIEQEHPSLVGVTGITPSQPSQNEDSGGCAGGRVYQCAHCTYITTDLRNVRVHVVAEHATTEGGFTEIKTVVSSDGNIIMNVNDAISSQSSSQSDSRSVLENGESTTAGSVKVDDEGKVFAVL